MIDDPYVYSGTNVLKNKLGITDANALDAIERLLVADRVIQGAPLGNFDLRHLRAIHQHLFQDIYDWAGELRTVEISKDREQFQFRQYIETGMGDVHRRLERDDYLKGLTATTFCSKAGEIMGDVNYVHPFSGRKWSNSASIFETARRRGRTPNRSDAFSVAGME